MIISYTITLVTLVITLICFALVARKYRKARSGPLTIKRRVIIINYLFLVGYLCSYFIHQHNDETEILCVPSMLILYLLWESYLATCTTFSNGQIYKNRYAWLFYNIVPATLIVPHILFKVMGQELEIHNYTQLIDVLSQPFPLQIYTRITLSMGLFLCKLIMLVEIIHQQFRYKKQIVEEKGELRGVKFRSIIYGAWALLLLAMTIGQIVPSMSYHIILRVLIIGFVICTTIFYLSFHKSLMAIEHNVSDEDNSIKEKIDTWLEQRPFPLSETDLTMEKTAESIGISTSSLSYYIYEFAGKTFLSWQSECRMNYCKELLEDERKNISEIAYECGYSDLAAMSKAFKKRFGVAPTIYRRKVIEPPTTSTNT